MLTKGSAGCSYAWSGPLCAECRLHMPIVRCILLMDSIFLASHPPNQPNYQRQLLYQIMPSPIVLKHPGCLERESAKLMSDKKEDYVCTFSKTLPDVLPSDTFFIVTPGRYSIGFLLGRLFTFSISFLGTIDCKSSRVRIRELRLFHFLPPAGIFLQLVQKPDGIAVGHFCCRMITILEG